MSTDVKDLVVRLRADKLPECSFDDRLSWETDDVAVSQLFSEAATALEAQAEEFVRLADENDELRRVPWPEWVMKVLAVIRARSGYDGYDDAIDGVDLSAELEEAMAELERERDALKAENERLREANGILEDALQEVGDDYPGSSRQEWCAQQIKRARAALSQSGR